MFFAGTLIQDANLNEVPPHTRSTARLPKLINLILLDDKLEGIEDVNPFHDPGYTTRRRRRKMNEQALEHRTEEVPSGHDRSSTSTEKSNFGTSPSVYGDLCFWDADDGSSGSFSEEVVGESVYI